MLSELLGDHFGQLGLSSVGDTLKVCWAYLRMAHWVKELGPLPLALASHWMGAAACQGFIASLAFLDYPTSWLSIFLRHCEASGGKRQVDLS